MRMATRCQKHLTTSLLLLLLLLGCLQTRTAPGGGLQGQQAQPWVHLNMNKCPVARCAPLRGALPYKS
jgi:hypothetical protein